MIDLCLINPPHPYLVSPHAQAPLGLLYVAGAVEREGFDVRIANLAGLQEGGSFVIPEARVYGLTGTHLDVESVTLIARFLKTREPNCRVVLGGPIVMSESELPWRLIDTVFQGEAEGHVAEIMDTPKGVVACRPLASKDLPQPARHLWPGPFGGNVFIERQNFFGAGSTTIMSSRGCPHDCAFCASARLRTLGGNVKGAHAVRLYPPDSVIAEMEECVQRFGVRQFRFSDEFFTVSRDHVHAICAGIRKSVVLGYGHDIAWRASAAVKPHDLDTFRHMAEAGCREVAFGVETADPVVLRAITRKGTVDEAYAALAIAKKAGLRTRALMMTGLPFETGATFWHNLEFFAKAEFDALALAIFTPFPGCEIFRNPTKFKCEILPGMSAKTVCLFNRNGSVNSNPRIRIEGMSDEAFTEHIQRTVMAAEATGRLGKG